MAKQLRSSFKHVQTRGLYGKAENVRMQIMGTAKRPKLVISVDLLAQRRTSASGKSEIIATTRGAINCPDVPEVMVNLNVYTRNGTTIIFASDEEDQA